MAMGMEPFLVSLHIATSPGRLHDKMTLLTTLEEL